MLDDMEDFGFTLEREKVERLRRIVDPLCAAIREQRMSLEETREAIEKARLEAALVVPEEIEKYDLIYGSRLERLLEQFPPLK